MVKIKSLAEIAAKEDEDKARVRGEKRVRRGEDETRVENCNKRIRTQEEVENKNEMDIHQETQGMEWMSGGEYLIRPEMMDISSTSTSPSCEIPSSDVLILKGHASQVFACAWSPSGSLLASGSHDSTARIWNISDGTCKSSLQSDPSNMLVLEHASEQDGPNHVHALDWNGDGTLLGTGSFDGEARIWNVLGELKSTLRRHTETILSLKWNKNSSYILTGSCDKTAIVWDAKFSNLKQHFKHHSGRVNDVDWRDNVSFATCSYDRKIHVCKIEKTRPMKTFSGHQGDINCVKWNPMGSLLASCSEDKTVKIWSMTRDQCVHNFKGHTKAVDVIRWRPNQPSILASGSMDSIVNLWDVEHGKLLCSLNGHRGRHVCGLDFSPNGEYLVSGAVDPSINIWSVKEQKIIKSYNGGSVTRVCWNKEGDKIAAGFTEGSVCVLDFRM